MREKHLKEQGLADLAYRAEADHEVQMARADLYKIAKYGIKLHEMLKNVSEAEGLEGWVQAKITKAADYLGSVYHHLDYEQKFDEVTESNKKLDEDSKHAEPEDPNSMYARLMGDISEIQNGALDGNDMADDIADELGDYLRNGDAPEGSHYEKAIGIVMDALHDGPDAQAEAAEEAISFLHMEEEKARGNPNYEEGRYDGPNSSCCDAPILNYDSDTKLGICSDCKDHASPHEDEEELDEGQYDGMSREELLKMKAQAEADIKNMQSSGDGPQQKFYDETQMMMAQRHLDDINNALAKMADPANQQLMQKTRRMDAMGDSVDYKAYLGSLLERKLSKGEENKKEKFVKGMKKSDSFKKYDDPKAVMYATATKMAKKKKTESASELCSECGNPSWRTLDEEKQKGVDGKVCWKGYKRMGTKKKGGKTVDNCVKM